MQKFNYKLLNIAFWMEIILSYLLPFKVIDGFQYKVGFPVAYISVYNTKIGVNPFMSMLVNPLALLFNVILLYLVLSFVLGIYNKARDNRNKSLQN